VIVGIGVDLVRVARVAEALGRFDRRFAARILGPTELARYDTLEPARRVRFLAMRFAAKEAGAKALGTGFRNGVAPRQLEVFQNALGRPGLTLSGGAAAVAEAAGVRGIHLSLADEGEYAIAFVTLES
jgi:holo-[acyl-carrier protein] synthase